MKPPAKVRNRGFGSEERLGGESPEHHNQSGFKEFQLREQMSLALCNLAGLGIAVTGRPALEYIGDEDISFAIDARCRQHGVEQFARSSDEGLALPVFFCSRSLADEQPSGVRRSGPGNRALTARSERTIAALFDRLGNRGPSASSIDPRSPGPGRWLTPRRFTLGKRALSAGFVSSKGRPADPCRAYVESLQARR